MTTETILQIFSVIVVVGVVFWLLDDPHDDDDTPDKGMMIPAYQRGN
jgi:hypothetical protein|tara:strand:- start:559 stop:699 length:141 start_codon:yes stop_codon:yes gene_type:complete